MGVDRIFLASDTAPPDSLLDAFVVVAGDDKRTEARTLVSDLRGEGLRVDMTDTTRSVKAQFKEADRSAAAAAIVVGEEWSSGLVAVKDLKTGEQREIPIKEIGRWLQA
jgi:histidyl-tRNA synthetase